MCCLSGLLQTSSLDTSRHFSLGREGPCRRRKLPVKGIVWLFCVTTGFSDMTVKKTENMQQLLLVLTAPIKASPEPMLMAVGMMLNFPAYERQQNYDRSVVVFLVADMLCSVKLCHNALAE